ncbi:DNA-processing protein DprA [Patescibacteria group bacterium]|nr:DNA-processing protein DprA [Patescibacteria group bacterium]
MSYQKSEVFVKPEWNQSRLGWLACAWFEKFGSVSLKKLQNHFNNDNGDKAFQASETELIKCGIIPASTKEFITWRKNIKPENLKKNIDNHGIDFFLPWDKPYPAILHQTSSPPGAIFWRGAPLDSRPWIAVVGTRRMSTYGKRATEKIVTELAQMGAGIISGLALGIDGQAHKSCIDAKGKTIAVLGCGLDDATIYPRAHQKLAEQILLNQGSLISEYPPLTPSLKHHFPLRNRIIAGLSKAVIVIEAGEKSGSVLTAKNALDENREVFAVPGPITSSTSIGSNDLIKQGAGVCTSATDILSNQNFIPAKTTIQTREPTMDEKCILDLCRTSTHVDDMARLLQLSPAIVSSTCLNLELMNALQDTGGGNYEITPTGRQMLTMPHN